MLITSLLSVLAPHECLGCGTEGVLLCHSCRSTLRPATSRCYRCHRATEGARTCVKCMRRSSVYAAHAAVRYESLAKDLVWKLKFGRARAAAREIGEMLALRFGGYDPTHVIVTYVPTATGRVRQRGYDQAARIAKAYARISGLPYAPLLAREGRHKQVGASRAVRLSQLAKAFRPLSVRKLQGAHVILVDDVITTGATLEAASDALKAAGAKRVEAVVFAQA